MLISLYSSENSHYCIAVVIRIEHE